MTKKTNEKKIEMTREEYIEHLSLKSNEISMSNNNSKTGKACLNIAFPVATCRNDAPCKATCYACHGCQRICNVQAAYYRNLRLYYENADNFFEQMYYKIKFSGLPKVRLFDSGDLPDMEFLVRLVELVKKFPDVKFGGFTKKYELVNEYIDKKGDLPDNLNILFSAWDKLWEVPNPHGLGVAYVNFKDERLTPNIPKNAFHYPGRKTTCSACGVCFSNKIKAVYFDEH